jgi:hypothetical protein
MTLEAQEALNKLKALLTNPPHLGTPSQGGASASLCRSHRSSASAAIMVERKEEGHALLV